MPSRRLMLFTLILLAGVFPPGPAPAHPVWIVEMAADPLARTVSGEGPAAGRFHRALQTDAARQRLDALQAGRHHLLERLRQHLRRPLLTRHEFSIVLNGLVLELSPREASRVRRMPGVQRVRRDRLYPLLTDAGPARIGADGVPAPEGSGLAYRGEGTIVGIIDTGIRPESPSFAPVGGDGFRHSNPLGDGVYLGDCVARPELCNAKLIGIRSYPTITRAYTDPVFEPERHRPADGRDYHGHGSHTAGTAAGNVLFDVPWQTAEARLTGPGRDLGFSLPRIAGVAPRAHIIAYQACYPGNEGDPFHACPGSVSVQAIEDAIRDGVDVLNFSIGGGEQPWEDPVALAFLNATAAGIVVTAATGNNGPESGTAGHVAPWLMPVGATTHDRKISRERRLEHFSGGDQAPATALRGAGTGAAIGGPVVRAADYDNGDPRPGQCLRPFPAGTFPPGALVVCERGGIARVDKIAGVAAGGAGGGILINIPGGATNVVADDFVLPGIHLDADAGQQLLTWLGSGRDHYAQLRGKPGPVPAEPGVLASFSGRGPVSGLALQAPALTAPGVQIYAPWTTDAPFSTNSGPAVARFRARSGTSMAAPHAAGAALLIRGLRRSWSPAAILSAMQLTADPGVVHGEGPAHLARGSGQLRVDRAVHSGLVLEEDARHYRRADPARGGRPEELNTASLVQPRCFHSCRFTRRLTATKPGRWQVRVEKTPGALVEVRPRHLHFRRAGARKTITITVTPDQPEPGPAPVPVRAKAWIQGVVRLTPEDPAVPEARMILSAMETDALLPERILADRSRSGRYGSTVVRRLQVKSTNSLVTAFHGPVPGVVSGHRIRQDPAPEPDAFQAEDGAGARLHTLSVGHDSRRLVARIHSPAPDLDLYVGRDLNGDGRPSADEVVCTSGSPTSRESCDLPDPQSGSWWILVHGYDVTGEGEPGSAAADAPYTLETAVVDSGPVAGAQMRVRAPERVRSSRPFSIHLVWRSPARGTLFGVLELGALEEQRVYGSIPVEISPDGD